MSRTPNSSVPDQVILPMSVGVGMCLRGLRARLGRSLVTVTGVALGTAFLMAVVAGALTKGALAEQVAARQEVDRRAALLRGQIGRLAGKRLLVLAVEPSAIELAFVRSLVGQHRAVVHLLGAEGFSLRGAVAASQTDPIADAMVGLGRFETLLANRPPGVADGVAAFAFGTPPIENVGHTTRPAFQHLSLQLHPDQVTRAEAEQAQARHRMTWIIGSALLIMTICIANAMLMSVTERIREIGTMKCLGALSGFVVRLFLIESAMIGIGGATIGAGAGALFALSGYAWLYGLAAVVTSVNLGPLLLSAAGCVLVGTLLATAAGIYPARVASKMIPASALASHV